MHIQNKMWITVQIKMTKNCCLLLTDGQNCRIQQSGSNGNPLLQKVLHIRQYLNCKFIEKRRGEKHPDRAGGYSGGRR
jgi:hypothetical protein